MFAPSGVSWGRQLFRGRGVPLPQAQKLRDVCGAPLFWGFLPVSLVLVSRMRVCPGGLPTLAGRACLG